MYSACMRCVQCVVVHPFYRSTATTSRLLCHATHRLLSQRRKTSLSNLSFVHIILDIVQYIRRVYYYVAWSFFSPYFSYLVPIKDIIWWRWCTNLTRTKREMGTPMSFSLSAVFFFAQNTNTHNDDEQEECETYSFEQRNGKNGFLLCVIAQHERIYLSPIYLLYYLHYCYYEHRCYEFGCCCWCFCGIYFSSFTHQVTAAIQ